MAGLFEKVTRPGGVIEYRHYLPGGSGIASIHTRRSTGGNSTYYWHADHLGSPEAFTDSGGTVLVRPSFGAFGERRDGSDWSGPPSAGDLTAIGNISRRGFTGHEHLDSVGLIHMNGRVYDPVAGRFLSQDPFVDGVFSSQGANGYAYVHNNPLRLIDPSGFCGGDVTEPPCPPGFPGPYPGRPSPHPRTPSRPPKDSGNTAPMPSGPVNVPEANRISGAAPIVIYGAHQAGIQRETGHYAKTENSPNDEIDNFVKNNPISHEDDPLDSQYVRLSAAVTDVLRSVQTDSLVRQLRVAQQIQLALESTMVIANGNVVEEDNLRKIIAIAKDFENYVLAADPNVNWEEDEAADDPLPFFDIKKRQLDGNDYFVVLYNCNEQAKCFPLR